MKKEINNKELEQVSGGFVPEYETDNAGIGGGNKASLSDEELSQVNGGSAPTYPAPTIGNADPQEAIDKFDEQVRKVLGAKERQ